MAEGDDSLLDPRDSGQPLWSPQRPHPNTAHRNQAQPSRNQAAQPEPGARRATTVTVRRSSTPPPTPAAGTPRGKRPEPAGNPANTGTTRHPTTAPHPIGTDTDESPGSQHRTAMGNNTDTNTDTHEGANNNHLNNTHPGTQPDHPPIRAIAPRPKVGVKAPTLGNTSASGRRTQRGHQAQLPTWSPQAGPHRPIAVTRNPRHRNPARPPTPRTAPAGISAAPTPRPRPAHNGGTSTQDHRNHRQGNPAINTPRHNTPLLEHGSKRRGCEGAASWRRQCGGVVGSASRSLVSR